MLFLIDFCNGSFSVVDLQMNPEQQRWYERQINNKYCLKIAKMAPINLIKVSIMKIYVAY